MQSAGQQYPGTTNAVAKAVSPYEQATVLIESNLKMLAETATQIEQRFDRFRIQRPEAEPANRLAETTSKSQEVDRMHNFANTITLINNRLHSLLDSVDC